ncbi:MAG: AAA family ATPase [Actinomycetota bacterium]|nr:AAA family ATPase [Actinomycetota bacterium]
MLVEAVLRVLAAVSRRRSAVLVLEDLQWADPDTLAVMEYVPTTTTTTLLTEAPGREVVHHRASVRLLLARAAAAAGEWEAAEHHLAAARSTVEGRDNATAAEGEALRAQIALGAHGLSRARRHAGAALELSRHGRVPERTCEALELLGRCYRPVALAQAEAHFAEALSVATDAGLTLWRLRALHQLGTVDVVRVASAERRAAAVEVHLAVLHLLRFELQRAMVSEVRADAAARRYGLGVLATVALSVQGAVQACRNEANKPIPQGRSSYARSSHPARRHLPATGRSPHEREFVQTLPMHQMLCPELVGREEEVEFLGRVLDTAVAGRGGVVLLTGEAGLGKSRMTKEAITLAGSRGMTVLAGRATPRTVPVPLRPLVEAFQVMLPLRSDAVVAELEPFRPALGRLVPQLGDARNDGEVNGPVLAEAVTRLLSVAARTHAVLLVLEDLHWADAETLEVVEYLADRLGGERVVCLGTVRTGEGSEAEKLARVLGERRSAGVVALRPLDPEATDRVAASCLGQRELPTSLREFIRSRSEGVPFLIEELLAGLAGADALVRSAGGWRVVSRLVPSVPLSFAETVERRLGLLDEPGRSVVGAAAILGRRFDWSLLPATTGLSEETVLERLRAAAGIQLLVRDPVSNDFQFRHALSRDAVLATLTPSEASRVAQSALDALEAAHPDLLGERCELAAELAERAGNRHRAGELLLASARRAIDRGAVATAEIVLLRARGLAPPTSALALDVNETMAHAAALSGHIDRAVGLAEGILAALDAEAGGAHRSAHLHLVLARAAITRGRWDVAGPQVEEALSAGSTEPAVVATAEALAAQIAIAEGRMDEAVRLARAALSVAETAGVPQVACEALEVLGRVVRPSDVGAAESCFERARAVAERHGLPLWRARALHELGTIDLYTTLSTDRLEMARRAAVEAGAVATTALVDLHLASIATALWDRDHAVPAAERCVDISRRLGLSTLGMGLVHLAVAHAQAGDEAAMERALEEAKAVAGDDPDVAAGVPGRARLGLALRRADFTAARRFLDEAVAILRPSPSTFLPFRGLWALLRTADDVEGDAARAETRQAVGAPLPFIIFPLRVGDAVALGRAGSAAEAERVFAAAEADHARYPREAMWGALVRRIAAAPALEDGWGTPSVWLRQALATFEAHQLEELASSCRALLRAAGEPVPRRGRGESAVPEALRALGVTSREVDVLRLVAERLSNREIAERLHLSHRTVERHVATLLAKVGAANRRQLAEVAARVGASTRG